MSKPLRKIPAVHELLELPALQSLIQRVSRSAVVDTVRRTLAEVRTAIQSTDAGENADAAEDPGGGPQVPGREELAEEIARRVVAQDTPTLQPVINATGILLHTGLGRAPLAEEALAAMMAGARDYASVELDLPSGVRSRRSVAVEGLLRELTGAEAALAVNNNAGATLLALSALAAGREVIVSRGQLIEIGGSYRLPEVMSASGAILREVGTTNKTRLDDYAAAISPQTAALLLVHPSNFVVMGFAESVELVELVTLARRANLPVIHDIGSGALLDFARFGLRGEPMAAESIRSGADVVLFSGDKLLGGPQAGIVLGRKELLSRIEKHPLARALRVDKLTLAALAATLRLYRDEEKAIASIPLLQLLSASSESLRQRAEQLASQCAAASAVAEAVALADVAYLGGGSLPTQEISTWCVALSPKDGSVDRLAMALRTGIPPVVGRVKNERLLLDLRSVPARQDVSMLAAIQAIKFR